MPRPPDGNAAVHARVMDSLAKMDKAERLRTLIDAGILTEDLQFTEPYGDAPMPRKTPDEQRAALAEDCVRCSAAPGVVCRSEYGTAVPHHAERFMAADRREAAARAANPEPSSPRPA